MSDLKRLRQKAMTWIGNVKRIYGWSESEAVRMYFKINPYNVQINEIAKKLFEDEI
jgi:hypothetical protein